MEIVCDAENSSVIAYLKTKNVSYPTIKRLLRTKDIKINGKRIKADQEIKRGDIIFLYTPQEDKKVKIVFEDQNIVVCDKPSGIEVLGEKSYIDATKKATGCELYAVHRLDRNTSGLIVFAKNKDSEAELKKAFKNHNIEKFYVAEVLGFLPFDHKLLVAYLKKDSDNSVVKISDKSQQGYQKIVTEVFLAEKLKETSIVKVKLHTGRTHQIRAHLAHIGHPIVGDNKYGIKQVNRKLGYSRQRLKCYKLIFHTGGLLDYLSNKEIAINNEEIF